jgi:hypothetical protein
MAGELAGRGVIESEDLPADRGRVDGVVVVAQHDRLRDVDMGVDASAVSCFLITFGSTRVLLTSFCCTVKKLIPSPSRAQIPLSTSTCGSPW